MKKIRANRVCEDCGTAMFRKGIDTDYNQTMVGWGCPNCFATKWDVIE